MRSGRNVDISWRLSRGLNRPQVIESQSAAWIAELLAVRIMSGALDAQLPRHH